MKRVFTKGEFDCDKDITVECQDGQSMTTKEFEDVVNQVNSSHIAYRCSSTSVSANKADELCKIAGFECDNAHTTLRKQHGRLWNYTGD